MSVAPVIPVAHVEGCSGTPGCFPPCKCACHVTKIPWPVPFQQSKRITIMDGYVHTFATSFRKEPGVFGDRDEAEGPFEISVSRNALMVHRAVLAVPEQVEAFNAAMKAAQDLFADRIGVAPMNSQPSQSHQEIPQSEQNFLRPEPWKNQKPAAPLVGLLHNLDSTICGCGSHKASTHGFCGFCHAALPADLKFQLFYAIGEAYQQWWAVAKKWLVDNTERYNGSGASRAVNLRVLPEAK